MRARALAAAALSVLAHSTIGAQATTVALHGIIRGSDGSTPLNARVRVVSRETSAIREAIADEKGFYRVLGLAPGAYDVEARALGYREHHDENLRLVVGQRAAMDISLDRDATALLPVVVRQRSNADVLRTDISTPVLEEEIAKLPLNSRNVLNVAAVAPGVRTFAPEGNRSIPSVGALAGVRFINLYVDGLEWKGTYVGNLVGVPAQGSIIPQEAVREFRIYLNPYDVEYTRGASWVMSAVTHRGGNTTEGSLFAFLQNRSLVAKSSFEQEKPSYGRVQAGGNVRGPVKKDRLFYSLTFEDQHTDNFVSVAPGRPAANPDIWKRYAGSFKAPQRLQSGVLRLTALSRSHTLDAIWATRHLTNDSDFGQTVDGVMYSHDAGMLTKNNLNSVLLRDTYTSASVVNELTFHLLDAKLRQTPLVPGPTFRYTSLQIGRNTEPAFFDTRHFRAVDKVSWTRSGPGGLHTIKTGLELNRVRVNTYRPISKDGLFVFQFDTSSQPLRAQIGLDPGDPLSTRRARDINNGWIVGAYLQDEWQPTPSFSVSAGVRYDAEINTLNQRLVLPWATDTTLLRAYGEDFLNNGDRQNDLNNFAPRIAASWDIAGDGRTSLRAGYGILYDRVPVFGAQSESIGAGWRTYTFQRPATTDPEQLRQLVLAGRGTSTPNVVLLKDRLETPRNRQWSVGFGRQLTGRWSLNLDFLDQRVDDIYVTVKTNLRHPVTGVRPITSRFGDVTLWDDFGDARFRALLASAHYTRDSAQLNVAYTLSSGKSEFGELTTSDYGDARSYTMQTSVGDERHRLVVSGFTGLKWGLELSAIAIVASPSAFVVTTGVDTNQNGTELDDWPDGVRTKKANGWSNWYRTLDMRMGKTLATRGGRVRVTAEIFNVLNSANHSEYQTKSNLLGYGEPVNDYARRQAQLGMRYEF